MRGEQDKRKLSSSKDFPKNWDPFYLFDETQPVDGVDEDDNK